MAHHLAEMITAAEDDSTVTLDQRQQVIEMILKIWSYRQHFPEGSPLEGYAAVFDALGRLSDDTPWRLRQLLGDDGLDSSAKALPLVAAAVELERLTQDTVVSLICLAAEDAQESNDAWLELADKVTSNVESRVTRDLQRLRRRRGAHPPSKADQPDEEIGTESATELSSSSAEAIDQDGASASEDRTCSNKARFDLPVEEDNASDTTTNSYHAARLRAMADVLTRMADQLAVADAAISDVP
jgi:hypothetical protein